MKTELTRHVISQGNIFNLATNAVGIGPEQGALTQMYLATSQEVESKNIKAQYYVCNSLTLFISL